MMKSVYKNKSYKRKVRNIILNWLAFEGTIIDLAPTQSNNEHIESLYLETDIPNRYKVNVSSSETLESILKTQK